MIKNLYSFFIFLVTSVSSVSFFLPEKVNAFPIYAQQAYENQEKQMDVLFVLIVI